MFLMGIRCGSSSRVVRSRVKRAFDFQPNEKYLRAAEAYRGKWVVVRRDEILLAGDDPVALQREARQRGLDYDVFEPVPDWDPETPLIL